MFILILTGFARKLNGEISGFSLTPYLESFTPSFGLGTPVFQRISSNLHSGTPTFSKFVSGTPVFKILVRTLNFIVLAFFCEDTM